MPYTDIFLYDVKAFDKDVHIKCTGQSNELILKNLKYIDSCNKSIEIRIPYVPDYNSDQIEKIAEFLKPLKNIKDVKVLPYHNYAGSKYSALGMENTNFVDCTGVDDAGYSTAHDMVLLSEALVLTHPEYMDIATI